MKQVNHGRPSASLLGVRDLITGRGEQPAVVPVSRTTLYRWVRDGQFPPATVRIGGRAFWLRSKVEEFLATQEVRL